MMPSRLILSLAMAAQLLGGCYESRGGSSDAAHDDPVVPDQPDSRDQDVVPEDRPDVTPPDIPPDPVPDPVQDPTVDDGPQCRPQEAYEDPDIDCDGCNPCDDTPYMWTGSRCEFLPICCMCAGADCDHRFMTIGDCESAYRECPTEPTPAPLYPEARLLWQAPGGFAGTGPMLLVDGLGFARAWSQDRGIYSIDSTEWGRTDYEAAENLGTRAANELFELLTTIDYSDLPHPPEGWGECYPTLELRPCGSCETIHLDYSQARDLLPEFWTVYDWMDQMLCRTAPFGSLPRTYCEFYD